jgi:hypothetical protein
MNESSAGKVDGDEEGAVGIASRSIWLQLSNSLVSTSTVAAYSVNITYNNTFLMEVGIKRALIYNPRSL